jgi:hypothetical protein
MGLTRSLPFVYQASSHVSWMGRMAFLDAVVTLPLRLTSWILSDAFRKGVAAKKLLSAAESVGRQSPPAVWPL